MQEIPFFFPWVALQYFRHLDKKLQIIHHSSLFFGWDRVNGGTIGRKD